MTKLEARKTHPDYPGGEDFAQEAELNTERDLLEKAKNLHGNGPDAFKPTLKITHENFLLKQPIKTLQGEMQRTLENAEIINAYDQQSRRCRGKKEYLEDN